MEVIFDHSKKWHSESSKAYSFVTVCKTGSQVREILIHVYRGYCESVLRYGFAVWGNSHELENVLKYQQKKLRLIFCLCPRHPCKDIFRRGGLMTVHSIFIQEILIVTFKNRHLEVRNFHHRNTRHGITLSFPRHRTFAYERSPFYKGVQFLINCPLI